MACQWDVGAVLSLIPFIKHVLSQETISDRFPVCIVWFGCYCWTAYIVEQCKIAELEQIFSSWSSQLLFGLFHPNQDLDVRHNFLNRAWNEGSLRRWRSSSFFFLYRLWPESIRKRLRIYDSAGMSAVSVHWILIESCTANQTPYSIIPSRGGAARMSLKSRDR